MILNVKSVYFTAVAYLGFQKGFQSLPVPSLPLLLEVGALKSS